MAKLSIPALARDLLSDLEFERRDTAYRARWGGGYSDLEDVIRETSLRVIEKHLRRLLADVVRTAAERRDERSANQTDGGQPNA